MNDIPNWTILIALVIIAILVIPLLYRGVKLKTKVIQLDTRQDKTKVDSIPSSHLRQYRRLKDHIIGDVKLSRKEYKAHFRNCFCSFITSLESEGHSIEVEKEKLLYKVTLDKALSAIFQDMVSNAICNNHFPKRATDESGNFTESETVYETRFYEEYTLPLATTVLGITSDFIDDKWKSEKISRDQFRSIYIDDEEAQEFIFKKFSSLIVKCRKHRDYIFSQIVRCDGTELQTCFDEWEIVYG